MIKKKSLVYNFFVFSIYILCFQYYLENQVHFLKYIDELYSFLFIPVILIYVKKQKISFNSKSVILLTMIIICGLLSNVIYKYQSIPYIIMDIILFLKFFMALGLSNFLFKEDLFEGENNKKLQFHVRLIIIILLFSTIINYAFNLWPNSNIRFGIMANQIFFGHPTKLSAVLFFLLAIYNIIRKGRIDIFYLFIFIMIFTTLRMKALLALAVSIFVICYVIKRRKKLDVKKLAIMGIVVCILGFGSFKYYFLSDGFARTELLRASFKIANDYFPLGTGFGTFGSWPSGVSYSPVYYLYDLNQVWGITPYNYLAIADSFWPTVMGQFGYLGMILYILLLIKIFDNIQKDYNPNFQYIYSSKLIAFIYLLVSSTSESAFFNQLSIPLGIIIGLNFSNILKEKDNNEHNI